MPGDGDGGAHGRLPPEHCPRLLVAVPAVVQQVLSTSRSRLSKSSQEHCLEFFASPSHVPGLGVDSRGALTKVPLESCHNIYFKVYCG